MDKGGCKSTILGGPRGALASFYACLLTRPKPSSWRADLTAPLPATRERVCLLNHTTSYRPKPICILTGAVPNPSSWRTDLKRSPYCDTQTGVPVEPHNNQLCRGRIVVSTVSGGGLATHSSLSLRKDSYRLKIPDADVSTLEVLHTTTSIY
jgi:hypothetical protein